MFSIGKIKSVLAVNLSGKVLLTRCDITVGCALTEWSSALLSKKVVQAKEDGGGGCDWILEEGGFGTAWKLDLRRNEEEEKKVLLLKKFFRQECGARRG